MAYYGLCKPIIAQLDTSAGTYSNGFACGKAVSTSVTPSYSEASLYGDNILAEYISEFAYADVVAGVTELPATAAEVLFGHSTSSTTSETSYGANDVANYVGYGFYASEVKSGVTSYTACWLPKVKFTEGADSFTTKGESITFSTPELSGRAMADSTKVWKYVKTFTTEADALAWLKEKANMQ